VNAVAWFSDVSGSKDQFLASASHDKTVRMWAVPAAK